jgi:hypothetical protein
MIHQYKKKLVFPLYGSFSYASSIIFVSDLHYGIVIGLCYWASSFSQDAICRPEPTEIPQVDEYTTPIFKPSFANSALNSIFKTESRL